MLSYKSMKCCMMECWVIICRFNKGDAFTQPTLFLTRLEVSLSTYMIKKQLLIDFRLTLLGVDLHHRGDSLKMLSLVYIINKIHVTCRRINKKNVSFPSMSGAYYLCQHHEALIYNVCLNITKVDRVLGTHNKCLSCY